MVKMKGNFKKNRQCSKRGKIRCVWKPVPLPPNDALDYKSVWLVYTPAVLLLKVLAINILHHHNIAKNITTTFPFCFVLFA